MGRSQLCILPAIAHRCVLSHLDIYTVYCISCVDNSPLSETTCQLLRVDRRRRATVRLARWAYRLRRKALQSTFTHLVLQVATIKQVEQQIRDELQYDQLLAQQFEDNEFDNLQTQQLEDNEYEEYWPLGV